MFRKTVKYLNISERAQAKKGSEETQGVVELAEVEVNEEDVEWMENRRRVTILRKRRRLGSRASLGRSG